ncbi:MAG: glutaredoxin family protein [bacterium]
MIKMYSTSWCPDCLAAKNFLKQKGIVFEEIDIENDPAAAKVVMDHNNGKRSVPTLDIDGAFVNLSPFNRQKLAELVNA